MDCEEGLYKKFTERELTTALTHLVKRRGVHNMNASSDLDDRKAIGSNPEYIHQRQKNGKRAVVTGNWEGKEYKLVIDGGKVITLYP